MVGVDDIVITGIGAVTPVGIGRTELEKNLLNGKCGSRELYRNVDGSVVMVASTVDDFDGKEFVSPRKTLKVMSREVQMAYAAAHLAWEDAGLVDSKPASDRMGVVFGSEMIPGDHGELVEAVRACSTNGRMDHELWGENLSKIFPLWMLRNLPNMPACHVAIAVDARGPNNTIAMEEISGILALGEAIGIMHRDQADLMVVGAVGNRVTPTRLLYRKPEVYFDGSQPNAPNHFHSCAFDRDSCGIVPAESAVCWIIERRRHAVARRAKIFGTVHTVASRCGRPDTRFGGSAAAVVSAAKSAVEAAEIDVGQLAAISAQGFSHRQLDNLESQAISQISADTPVTAMASYVGTAGSASGLAQLTAALLGMQKRVVLPILGCNNPNPSHAIQICQKRITSPKSHLLQLSYTFGGQAAAVVIDCQ